MQPQTKVFDQIKTKLLTGINLLEASAGTGKTYTITMLVLRFVVEKKIDIKQILVVSFTNATTEELKNRIRKRLLDVRLIITQDYNTEDTNIKLWLKNLKIKQTIILQRLNAALLDIDRLSIFTIHGFCKRILANYTLDSGQLFDAELITDINEIKQSCADDFWRQQIYERPEWETTLLTQKYKTPEALLATINFIVDNSKILPNCTDLDGKLNTLKNLIKINKSNIETNLQSLQYELIQNKFKQLFTDDFLQKKLDILDWLNQKNTISPDFSVFTKQKLLEALNGNKFRTSKVNPCPSEEQKRKYIESIDFDTQLFATLSTNINNISLVFRTSLLQTLDHEVNKKLKQLNGFTFANLISHLTQILRNPTNSTLIDEIKSQYKATLIDEFQDTDAQQWFIFSTLFKYKQHYLYLIGDPKQAIYKFRNADINSYFKARKQAKYLFTLTQNWRSHPNLVNAVNALFAKKNAFFSTDLSFRPVNSALTSEQAVLMQENKALTPLVLWQLEESNKCWTSKHASNAIKTAVVNEIVTLLTQSVYIQSQFFIKSNKHKNKALQPSDIAILVANNTQAKEFQQAINEVGINAVINNKESVFCTAESKDLYLLLQALAKPTNSILLKRALALDWFNLSGQQLYKTLNDEVIINNWIQRFQGYQFIWQNKGLLAMMKQLQDTEKIQLYLSTGKNSARRIANLLHCVELLQQTVIDKHLSISQTLDWLQYNITQASHNKTPPETEQLRLESDNDALKIITMHSAKGLEYPIVFCPFLWHISKKTRTEKYLIKCHVNGEMIIDLGSEQFKIHRNIALDEELAEAIRLFYVAITRAKYRCYISWADVRSKNTPNQSSMAYLFDFSTTNFAGQQIKLQNYSNDAPELFAYKLIPAEQKIAESIKQNKASTKQLNHRHRKRKLYTHWQMSSYTALTALNTEEVPELPNYKAQEQTPIKPIEYIETELPHGVHVGNVIHDLLENIPFKQLAKNKGIILPRTKSCRRHGLQTSVPEQIDQLLQETVNTVLATADNSFRLKDLNENRCLKEMPFYLSIKTIDLNEINLLLKDHHAFHVLSAKKISGYLTGFIDLICEYKNKYYVIDYKSNYLENYDIQSLNHAMHENNYGLQYWIYTIVLHQYLKNKLPDYDYNQHIGGVKYLFVRGMNKNLKNSGVYQTKPEQTTLKKLAQLFVNVKN